MSENAITNAVVETAAPTTNGDVLNLDFLRAARAANRLSPELMAVLQAMENPSPKAAPVVTVPRVFDASFPSKKDDKLVIGVSIHVPGVTNGRPRWLKDEEALAIATNPELQKQIIEICGRGVDDRTDDQPEDLKPVYIKDKPGAVSPKSAKGKKAAKTEARKADKKPAKVAASVVVALSKKGFKGDKLKEGMELLESGLSLADVIAVLA